MARSGFEVQKVTVEALFLREIRTRFGKFRLGYLWAILEPSAHLLILLGIFGYIMHRTMPDISFPVFLLNGLIPFFIFSSISKRSVGAIEANQGLFNYRPVKPIDTIIARALLETLIYVHCQDGRRIFRDNKFFTTCGYLESADHTFMQHWLNIHGRW